MGLSVSVRLVSSRTKQVYWTHLVYHISGFSVLHLNPSTTSSSTCVSDQFKFKIRSTRHHLTLG